MRAAWYVMRMTTRQEVALRLLTTAFSPAEPGLDLTYEGLIDETFINTEEIHRVENAIANAFRVADLFLSVAPDSYDARVERKK